MKSTVKTNEIVQDIEKYINAEDEPSSLFNSLQDRVDLSGLESLSKPEQIYYAVNEFYNFLWNEGAPAYFEYGDELLLQNVAEGFVLLREPVWIEGYDRLCEALAGEDKLTDADELDIMAYEAPFLDDNQSLLAAIDAYAEQHGLLAGDG